VGSEYRREVKKKEEKTIGKTSAPAMFPERTEKGKQLGAFHKLTGEKRTSREKHNVERGGGKRSFQTTAEL